VCFVKTLAGLERSRMSLFLPTHSEERTVHWVRIKNTYIVTISRARVFLVRNPVIGLTLCNRALTHLIFLKFYLTHLIFLKFCYPSSRIFFLAAIRLHSSSVNERFVKINRL